MRLSLLENALRLCLSKSVQSVLLGTAILLHTPQLTAGPAQPDITNVPEPILEEHPGWVELYYRAFEIAFEKIQRGTPENGFVDFYMDEAFNPNIFQWDTSFIMMFTRYGNGELPGVESLDNFYNAQHDDGWIGRELREKDGSSYWPKAGSLEANCAINPPLFSWAEWENYRVSGDIKTLKRKVNGRPLLEVLVRYFDWIKQHRRWESGLYWTTSYANGMDRSPRLGTDHVCEHANGSWIDISAQQALNARFIARIAAELGEKELHARFLTEHRELAHVINAKLWDEQSGFYYDITANGQFYKVKTPASFWPMLAGVTTDVQEQRLVDEHVLNPQRFWTKHHIPTVAKDEPSYMPDGGYWDGAVWAPTTYATVKGLEQQGYRDVARRVAANHIEHLYWVYRATGTLYENYKPEAPEPGKQARPDFVGWTGVGPIALLIENILGLTVNAPADMLTWDLALTEAHGIRNLRFGDNTISLLAADRPTVNAGTVITVETTSPFVLDVVFAGETQRIAVPKGKNTYEIGKPVKGLLTVSAMPAGVAAVPVTRAGRDKTYQTFTAPANGRLVGVDVKVAKTDELTDVALQAELYSLDDSGKVVGEPLTVATVTADDVEPFYSVVHVPLAHPAMEKGQQYAVVLAQLAEHDRSAYHWLSDNTEEPRRWLKVYLQKSH